MSIDGITATATGIGVLADRLVWGATFTPEGDLVVISGNDLLTINPTTGMQIGSALPLTFDGSPFEPGNGCDVAVDFDGQAFISRGVVEYHMVNLVSGELTLHMADDADSPDGYLLFAAGIAFPTDPDDRRLFVYDVNGDADIFAYDAMAPFARSQIYGDIISNYNAGRGDLASYTGAPTTIDEEHSDRPALPRLLPSFPNPFNPSTTISFTLPQSGEVFLTIHAIDGSRVATLLKGDQTQGLRVVRWSAIDESGRALPSGVYLAQLSTPDGHDTQRLILLK